MSIQERIKKRPQGGGKGGSSDESVGTELGIDAPESDDILTRLTSDIQRVDGMISRTYERINQQRPSKQRDNCSC